MMEFNFTEIVNQFAIDGALQNAEPYGDGHINDTFLVTSNKEKYILQRISKAAFSSPEDVMENIVAVTAYLSEKIKQEGGDPLRETLTLIPCKDGGYFYQDQNGEYFRMYLFISGARTFQVVQQPSHFYHAARAFGKFQNMLSDFPAEKLHETIVSFHDTRTRYEQLDQAIAKNASGRLDDVQAELEFALARRDGAGVIMEALEQKRIPYRVTHNDTKLNNVMIDDATGEGICVIDLDTVMPGSMLFDFGDAIRFGTNPVAEDEKDLSKVYSDIGLFEQFTKGFLEELGGSITAEELELLPESGRILTLECGIRFLADYLNGDVYFHTARPEHNLDRARVQFQLVADMERNMDEMKQIVKQYAK